jgi:hypothetical protein
MENETKDKFTEHQRKAGQSKSEAKRKAAAENLRKAREAKKRKG